MGLGLDHSVQIEPAFDRVETALQPLGIGPVYPGEAVEAWQPMRLYNASCLGRRLERWGQDCRLAPAQRLHVPHGLAPQKSFAAGRRHVTRLRHYPCPADRRRG
jgi:hypothetical protein